MSLAISATLWQNTSLMVGGLVARRQADTPMARASLVLQPASEPTRELNSTRVASARHASWGSQEARVDDDGLSAFESEQELTHEPPHAAGGAPPAPSRTPALLALGVIAAAGAVTSGYMYVAQSRATLHIPASAVAVVTGQAQFDSRPTGADVLIDGHVRGKTPLTLALPIGAHTLEMRNEEGSRTLPLTIETGVVASHYVELQSRAGARTGRLEIASDPPGVQVFLDGVAKGVTPVTLDAIEARDHVVSLTRGGSTLYRTVRVEPGSSASVVVSMHAAAPGAVGGYLALRLPFEVQVLEGGRLVGTSSSERLMMPAGRHQLELVNAALQFRTTIDVNIEAGRVASPAVATPEGALAVNALPWADVTIDGRSVGTTPLADVRLPVGSHDIVWRHPDLGERRQTVVVTAGAPVRIGVNFTQ